MTQKDPDEMDAAELAEHLKRKEGVEPVEEEDEKCISKPSK